MKKLLLSLGLALGLASPAFAGNPYTSLPVNANYSALITDFKLVPTGAVSGSSKTITLPSAGGTCVGGVSPYFGQGASCGDRFEIVDMNGVMAGPGSALTCYNVTAQSGDLLNGVSGGTITFCNTYGRLVLRPFGGIGWQVDSQETLVSGACPGTATTFTSVANTTGTWSTTTPTVGLFTLGSNPGFVGACPLQITGGSQSTGVSTSTTYWTIPGSYTGSGATAAVALASSVPNALAGTALTITGSAGSGQTLTMGVPLTTATPANITGVILNPGEWDCRASIGRTITSTTSFTNYSANLSTSSTAVVPSQAMVLAGNATNVWAAAIVPGVTVGPTTVVGPARFSVTSATNLYLSTNDAFTASTDAAGGTLTCRRVL